MAPRSCLGKAGNSFCNAVSKRLGKEVLAEFIATFVFVTCGLGVTASCTLNNLGQDIVLISAFGWGFAYAATNCMVTAISGGHCNPAVTLALACIKKCSWRNVLPFMVAQYAASFVAAGVVYLTYAEALFEFDVGAKLTPPLPNATAQIFTTFPQEWISDGTALWNEILGTAMLLVVILATVDRHNLVIPHHSQAVIIGLGLVSITLIFGHNCGTALNPARDLAPRVFIALCGWGEQVFSFRNYKWFWIPALAPHLGAIIGAWTYYMIVEMPFESYGRILGEEERIRARERKRVQEEERRLLSKTKYQRYGSTSEIDSGSEEQEE